MRKVKQGKRGQASKYISRAKAIRKLQLSLKDFRKICILKGVYPREAPKKLKKHNRTYYHLKDINFLALDPLITRLRAQKVYTRKFKRAKSRGDIGKVKHLVTVKPKLSLNHLVRQRYPDFLDALKDLDDPLSLIALFSIFPSHKEYGISNKKIALCNTLMRQLELYIVHSHCLKKAFVSIKGIYYQLEILGVKITYITPYKYPPSLPIDVDYRVMSTFLDFYLVLLKFVLYKLYSLKNWEYPPTLKDQSIQNPTYEDYDILPIKTMPTDQKYQIDKEFQNPQTGQQENLLLKNLKFFLSTQVPKYSLQLIILAQGGAIAVDVNDSSITHVITDRQNVTVLKTRQYVQPQWIYDSINFNRLLNVKQYWIGKQLPPHVSPFVDENNTQRHIPERQRQLRQQTQGQEKPQQIPRKTSVQKNEKNKQYDIAQQINSEQKKKKEHEKQFAKMSRSLMSNKNRKILKNIEIGKVKKTEKINKLKQKAAQNTQ